MPHQIASGKKRETPQDSDISLPDSRPVNSLAVQVEAQNDGRESGPLLSHYQAKASLLAALINTAHDAAIAVDADCKVLFNNTAAEDAFINSHIVRVVEGCLKFRSQRHQSAVYRAIQQAVVEKTTTELVITDEGSGQKWWVTILPLSGRTRGHNGHGRTAVAVILHDSTAKDHQISEFLRQGYEMSAAEIRLAKALAQGATPEEYAATSGLKITTIRSHLRSIFAKTGTRRQAEVVRLLTDVPRVRAESKKPCPPEEDDATTISKLTRQLQRLHLMDRITQLSLQHDEPASMLQDVLHLVREVFDADRCGLIYPCNPDAPTWASQFESTKPEWETPVPVGTTIPMTPDVQTLLREALATEQVIVRDPSTKQVIPKALADIYLTKSEMYVALKPNVGEPWLFGLVHCAEGHVYSEENQQLLAAIGQRISDRLGILISTKQLRESEGIFRDIFQNSPIGMAQSTPEGKFLYVNKSLAAMLQFESSEDLIEHVDALGEQLYEVPSDRRELLAAISKSGKWEHRKVNLRRKDGTIICASIDARLVKRHANSPPRIEAFVENITLRENADRVIWQQANFDPLTQFPNRNLFQERLRQDTVESASKRQRIALLLIDLDRFKEVNDTLGHYAGDLLLKEAAQRICQCVPAHASVARLGGDEFTVTLSGEDACKLADSVAQSIIDSLATPFALKEETAYISASIGITIFPDDATDISGLLKNADQAMYVAKDGGRNRFSRYTPALKVAAENRKILIKDLHGALAADQFQVYFQPIVEFGSGRMHKAEALLRWNHPSRGLVSPAEFITIAEDTGMIVDIGEWVFEEAAKWAKRWSRMIDGDFQVSVNKSPLQMLASAKKRDWVDYLLSQGMSGKNITVEITEGLLLKAESGVTSELLRLRDAGIQVAIDDFGTGYSSLSYLNKFDIDYLKIDQSFVSTLSDDPVTWALPEAIIAMAHKLGLKVIAEGIETEEQRKFLLQAGCDFGQGYFFSHPVPAEAFEIYLTNCLSDQR